MIYLIENLAGIIILVALDPLKVYSQPIKGVFACDTSMLLFETH